MKLLHVSDIHLHAEPVCGSEPITHFRRALEHIVAHHADADKLVITGDLTETGDEWSYRQLQSMLDDCGLPAHLAPALLLGNHDERTMFRSVFPDCPVDAQGFIQSVEDTPAGRFVYLDTLKVGEHGGQLCEDRLGWLTRSLDDARADEQPVWLFMHHNPMPVHVPSADTIGLERPEAFRAVLEDNRDLVRHVFFGHCHFSLSGNYVGVPFSAPRSTNHPHWPDIDSDAVRFGQGPLERSYDVCLIDELGTVVHTIDFERSDEVHWIVVE